MPHPSILKRKQHPPHTHTHTGRESWCSRSEFYQQLDSLQFKFSCTHPPHLCQNTQQALGLSHASSGQNYLISRLWRGHSCPMPMRSHPCLYSHFFICILRPDAPGLVQQLPAMQPLALERETVWHCRLRNFWWE